MFFPQRICAARIAAVRSSSVMQCHTTRENAKGNNRGDERRQKNRWCVGLSTKLTQVQKSCRNTYVPKSRTSPTRGETVSEWCSLVMAGDAGHEKLIMDRYWIFFLRARASSYSHRTETEVEDLLDLLTATDARVRAWRSLSVFSNLCTYGRTEEGSNSSMVVVHVLWL
jgi:hypothetical protein